MRHYFLGTFFLVFVSALGQNTTCRDFHNGRFQMVSEDAGTLTIERNGSQQIEYGSKSRIKMELKVTWLNECTYTLQFVRFLKNPDRFPKPPKNMAITVEIIETRAQSYVQKSSSNIDQPVRTHEIVRIQ